MKENRYLFRVTPEGATPGSIDDLIVEVYDHNHDEAAKQVKQIAEDCGFGQKFKYICIKVGTVSPDGRYHQ